LVEHEEQIGAETPDLGDPAPETNLTRDVIVLHQPVLSSPGRKGDTRTNKQRMKTEGAESAPPKT
jgi:hypothetical protein